MHHKVESHIHNHPKFLHDKIMLESHQFIVHNLCHVTSDIKWNCPVYYYKKKSLCYLNFSKSRLYFGFWSKVPLDYMPEYMEKLKLITKVYVNNIEFLMSDEFYHLWNIILLDFEKKNHEK